MNNDLVSYGHAQIRIWVHIFFKTKYAHNVFDLKVFRDSCKDMMQEIMAVNKIECDTDIPL